MVRGEEHVRSACSQSFLEVVHLGQIADVVAQSPLRGRRDCDDAISDRTMRSGCPAASGLGNPMERKAVSQHASRPFGVPQLSMKRSAGPLPVFVRCPYSP